MYFSQGLKKMVGNVKLGSAGVLTTGANNWA